MSEEQLKAFLEKVKADTSLLEQLKAAADVDAVTAIAKEAGFMISADDFKSWFNAELSDSELEGVAGGYPGNTDGCRGCWNRSSLQHFDWKVNRMVTKRTDGDLCKTDHDRTFWVNRNT
ncbi:MULTISPECIES: Nif11-like leader peptide family natural product precursor [unclassified Prochlorococcus]|uniref:Nif11-like leader peptide family natural product precursor n=1 Tax=unclassified Prochlorococcus TaxID=2627481 RepID=UPI000533B66C|nr:MULTISPECIES: Nif11-like leader peptide family natural product precursor [unclassified Prochlorococcus]KGG25563.1 putative SAP domain [Prochlorococcus sp. MIT 0701]KGG30689.1 putative SAP domain [Prochlorococcus sp. MIT 0702]KGG34872.1 putative SAP domain [Prochlorococcus sp. MIT 0703]